MVSTRRFDLLEKASSPTKLQTIVVGQRVSVLVNIHLLQTSLCAKCASPSPSSHLQSQKKNSQPSRNVTCVVGPHSAPLDASLNSPISAPKRGTSPPRQGTRSRPGPTIAPKHSLQSQQRFISVRKFNFPQMFVLAERNLKEHYRIVC